jgi:Family of unknown function (DUF6498)
MIKKTLTRSDYFLIAANLLPVAGVWFWNWSPYDVFISYCLETIIIGIFNLLKMGIVTATRKTDIWYNGPSQTRQSGLFFMFFFLIHYGFFVAVQMGIFFSVSGISKGTDITAFNFFFKWPQLISNDALIMIGVFVFVYGYKMVVDFILSRQYQTIPMMLLMFQPYGRIFVQQLTVILGSMFLSFGAGKIFILIFAVVKIFFELLINFGGMLTKTMSDMKKGSGE